MVTRAAMTVAIRIETAISKAVLRAPRLTTLWRGKAQRAVPAPTVDAACIARIPHVIAEIQVACTRLTIAIADIHTRVIKFILNVNSNDLIPTARGIFFRANLQVLSL